MDERSEIDIDAPNIENGANDIQVAANHYARLQMPPFIESDIDGWFYLMNFYFSASGITGDQRKFDTVCSQIPLHRVSQLRHTIDNAPGEGKFDYIKGEFIKYFTESQQKRLQKVLKDMPLGDKLPSILYHEMQRTAGDSLTETVLLDLWAARLPSPAQAAVIITTTSTAEKLKIADSIVENLDLRQVNSVTHDPEPCGSNSTKFSKMYTNKNGTHNRQHSNQRQPRVRTTSNCQQQNFQQPNINKSQRRDSSIEQFDDCWYHRTFGKNATQCRPSCKFRRPSAPSPKQQ